MLYRTKYLLNELSLKCIYFAYIHLYLTYANIAWASTYRTNLKAIYLLQKRAVRIVFNENNMTHSRLLLRSLNALDICQINLFQHLRFMYNFNKNETPIIFINLIKKPIISIQQNFQKTVLVSKHSSSMVQNIVFLSEDPKFGMIF